MNHAHFGPPQLNVIDPLAQDRRSRDQEQNYMDVTQNARDSCCPNLMLIGVLGDGGSFAKCINI